MQAGVVFLCGDGVGLPLPFLFPADKNADMMADTQAAMSGHEEEAPAESGGATRQMGQVPDTDAHICLPLGFSCGKQK